MVRSVSRKRLRLTDDEIKVLKKFVASLKVVK